LSANARRNARSRLLALGKSHTLSLSLSLSLSLCTHEYQQRHPTPRLTLVGCSIKWSFDDKYFAFSTSAGVSIYESDTMSLLDKKKLKVAECKDFAWSPSDHLLAVASIPETGDLPSRVVLVSIPSRIEIATKTLFNVVKVRRTFACSISP